MAGLPDPPRRWASLAVLKTADPPYTALVGPHRRVGRPDRQTLVITTVGADDGEPLHLVIHLSRAGWVRWSENLSPTPPPRRQGSHRCACTRACRGGFDVTGTQ